MRLRGQKPAKSREELVFELTECVVQLVLAANTSIWEFEDTSDYFCRAFAHCGLH